MILATINPWVALYILLAAFLVACALTAITLPLGILVGRLIHDRRTADQQNAADHGEPTREAVERLVDGDEWARRNGYDDGWLFTDDIDAEWRRICEATGGAA